jgi:hypothetical protein
MTGQNHDLRVQIGDDIVLGAILERARAPRTCAALERMLPLERSLVHVRWSGEGVWMPLDDVDLTLPPENATAHPLPGQVIVYADPLSENEMLLAYGAVSFASIAGPLAGNHALTLDAQPDVLREIGRRALWEGALRISIRSCRNRS